MQDIWKSEVDKYSRIMSKAYPVVQRVYPFLKSKIKDSKHILDYGCGDGSFCLNIETFSEITLFDKSEDFIQTAKEKLKNINSNFIFCSDEKELDDNKFDFINLCFVVMSLSSIEEVNNLLKVLRNKKTDNGTLIISLTHPCFRQYKYSYFYSEFAEYTPFNYSDNGKEFDVKIFDIETKEELKFKNYHYTTETIYNLLKVNNFAIISIKEIYDYDPKKKYNTNFPPYLIIECK